MHWQASIRQGDPITGEAADFSTIRSIDVAEFSIVERFPNFCLVKWEMPGLPLAYEIRSTPNENVHVIDAGHIKIFVFEGTGEVVKLTKWDSGVFGPIPIEERAHGIPEEIQGLDGP